MGDFVPKFIPGNAVTFTAEADVTGGRLVEVTGDRAVGPAEADSAAVSGTAARDAKAGESVLVWTGGVHELVAAGAIAAGAAVSAAAGGKVASGGVNKVGLALTAAAAADDVVQVLI